MRKISLYLLLFCFLLYGCTPKENNEIIMESYISGKCILFDMPHIQSGGNLSILFNSDEFKEYIIKNKKLLYEKEIDNIRYFFFKEYGTVFGIKCIGQNIENQNLYEYILYSQELQIDEKTLKINEQTGKEYFDRYRKGYIIFPTILTNRSGYIINEIFEYDFSILTEFYSYVSDAVIDYDNETIILPIYENFMKSIDLKAKIRKVDTGLIEIILEEV